MRLRAAPLLGLVLTAGACTSLVGLPDVPTPVEGGDDGSSSGATSGSSGGSTSGASSGADSTVGEGGGGDGTTSSSGASSGVDGSSSGSEAGSSSGTTSSGSGSGAEGGPDSGDGCASVTENCFNGVDDNCDGKVDCADPQCTGGDGGAAPVAECVPDPGGLTAGILSTAGADAGPACPATYPTTTALYAGLTPGSCSAGSCVCGGGMSGTPICSASLTSKGGSVTSCNLGFGTNVFSKASTDGCFAISPALSSGTWYTLSTPTLSGATCNPSNGGAAAKNPPTWTTTSQFCSGVVGAGCASGQVCMPAAANHCVLETGNQAACSHPGYPTINTTPYYTGYDDSGRACACTCNVSGSCSTVVGFGSGSCGGLLTAVGAGCQAGLNFDHAQISAPNAPGCTPGAMEGGSTSTTGAERTVCCLH